MRGHGLASGARRVATLTRPHARPPRPTAGRRRPPWPLPAPSPFPETRTLAGPPAALPAACQPSGCPPWLDCCSHDISPGFLWPLMRAALPPGRAQSSFSRATMTACELVVRCQVLSDTVRPRNWTLLDGPEPSLRRPFEAPACSWLVRGSAPVGRRSGVVGRAARGKYITYSHRRGQRPVRRGARARGERVVGERARCCEDRRAECAGGMERRLLSPSGAGSPLVIVPRAQ